MVVVCPACKVARAFGSCCFWGAFAWGRSLGGTGNMLGISHLEQDPRAAAPLFFPSLLLSNADIYGPASMPGIVICVFWLLL